MVRGVDQGRGLLVSGRFSELEDALCERVRGLRRGGPLTPVMIVVGSTELRTRIGDLLVRRLEAVANVAVVTLRRFADDLVTEALGEPPAALAGLTRERLLRIVIARQKAQGLGYFAPVADRPHFPQALAASFADLRQARLAPDQGWAALAGGMATGRAGARVARQAGRSKAADLERLYVAYCDEIGARHLHDEAQVYVDAAQALRARHATCCSGADTSLSTRLILYGFYDLNEAQEALVGEAFAVGADAFVPIPRGRADSGVTVREVALAAGLDEAFQEPPAPAADLDRMAAVWQAVQGPTPSNGAVFELVGDGSLRVVSVADERGESREAVRAVLEAARAGAAFWDCAVVVPHRDGVEYLSAALKAAEVPVACACLDRSLGPRILMKLADCLSPPAGGPFARRAVLDLLAAAPLRIGEVSAREIALWTDEARQAGVVGGLEQWTARLGRRRHGLECRLESLESAGVASATSDGDVERAELVRLRLAAVHGLQAAVEELACACGRLPLKTTWDAWAEALGGVAEALFEAPAAADVRDTTGFLQSLAVLAEEVDVVEVTSAIREQFANLRRPEGRVGRNGVAVLTPADMRGLRFHSVVFTGLAEGGFPARGRPDPLLGDAERRRLGERLGVRLPLADQRDAESLLQFAFVCEAARERLTLLAPRTDAATGRPRLPSRLLLRLASLVSGRAVGLEDFLSGVPLASVWRRVSHAPAYLADPAPLWLDAVEHDTAALLALSERGGRASREYLAMVVGDVPSAQRRLAQWCASRSPEPGVWDGLLGPEARGELASRHPFDSEMHPTRLERYLSCPFAFLLRDVLGLAAPEEPTEGLEMDAREQGTLAHAILQRAYEAVIAGQLELDGALRVVAEAWEACCAEAERRGVTGAALSWQARRAMLLEDLLEAVRRDPVFAGGADRPLGVEWRFGEAADRPVAIELAGGRTVRFAGRLDRIDETPAGVRIIDYKTGGGEAERKRLKDGLGVQLPVYQLAVRQAGDAGYGEISCLYRFITRKGGFGELPLAEPEAVAGDRLQNLVGSAVGLVDRGLFPRTTAGRCEYCDLRYACGISSWARARKREHGSLDDIVGLQRSGPREPGAERKGGDDAGA